MIFKGGGIQQMMKAISDTIPASHPRRLSLETRAKLSEGVRSGITSFDGLIAHGRGEAFDYLLGEHTHDFAHKSIEAAASLLLMAKYPIISVNGNTAALVPDELIALSKASGAKLEVNIFHTDSQRELRIRDHLMNHGADNVLLPDTNYVIPFLDSNRKFVNPEGIFKADVVFVPLEDGDRCEALIHAGKKVITVDLNPMSRTARTASITIVDNIIRVMPLLINSLPQSASINDYDNVATLANAEAAVRSNTHHKNTKE